MAEQVYQQICPLVAIESESQSLSCEISGVAHLFGDETGLLIAVEKLLASMKINGQMAIADSVGAAWAVAHYANTSGRDSTRTEQDGAAGALPSRIGGAAGALPSRIIPPGQTRQALEPLPVESLRIGTETTATLARLGVHFVSQLLRLPRSGLAPRLGKPLVRRIEQALGEVDEAINVYHPPVEYTASHRLEYSTSDQKILADRIARLIKEVRAGMATCQRGALRMTCRLDLSDHPPLTLEVGLFAPTIDTDHLYGLLTGRMESTRLPAPVLQLTLSIPLTGALKNTQNALFAKNSNETSFSSQKSTVKKISRLIDSLSGRLGCNSVVGVKIKNNPLPEKAFSVSPLAGTGSPAIGLVGKNQPLVRSQSRSKSSSHFYPSENRPSPEDAMRRPLSLLSKPLLIAVANDNGPFGFVVSSSDVPQRIRVGGTVHSIVRSWGSERIETSWWNGPSIRRDYYRIETDSALWWWVFRDFASKIDGYRWMLHGKFN